jgi:hypothetical protein
MRTRLNGSWSRNEKDEVTASIHLISGITGTIQAMPGAA